MVVVESAQVLTVSPLWSGCSFESQVRRRCNARSWHGLQEHEGKEGVFTRALFVRLGGLRGVGQVGVFTDPILKNLPPMKMVSIPASFIPACVSHYYFKGNLISRVSTRPTLRRV